MREGKIPIVWLDHNGIETEDRSAASPCLETLISNPKAPYINPVTVFLLVDSGADLCQFSADVFIKLACQPHRDAKIASNHDFQNQPIYEITLQPIGCSVPVDGEASICAIETGSAPFSGLIGRHYLQYGRLVLDGPQGESAFYYRFPDR